MDIYNKLAQAIMSFEGYYEDSVAYENHNPGNLKYRNQPGTIGVDDMGHAIFKTFEDGYIALLRLIKGWWKGTETNIYHPDMTLLEIFSKYAEANSKEYAEYIAWRLGVEPTTKLRELV